MVHVKIFSLNVRNIVDQNSVLNHLKDDMEKIHFLALQKHFTKHLFETFLPHQSRQHFITPLLINENLLSTKNLKNMQTLLII